MILQSLSDLARRGELLEDPHYEPKEVAWVLAVGDGGRFLAAISTTGDAAGSKKPRAKMLAIPRRKGRTSGATAHFLVDKSEYVLGVEPDGKRKEEDLLLRRNLFRADVDSAAEKTGCAALNAVSSFLASDAERAHAISRIQEAGYRSNDLFAFEYGGQLVHQLPECRDYFAKSRRSVDGASKQCLVCGALGPLAEKHPSVQIPGGTTSGIALVSFNSDAFESYGLSRNENAPVCRECAEAYTTALKRLLSTRYPNPTHAGETLPCRFARLPADTTAVYWAEEEDDFLAVLEDYFNAPRVEEVGTALRAPREGRSPGKLSSRFYCLILSGGQGRATLRGMHTSTVEQVERNVTAYFDAIEIGDGPPLPLRRLLESLVFQGKAENLPPDLASEFFRAALFGGDFPRTALARAVERCMVEQRVSRERAALLRAYLIRNLGQEVTVGLDTENVKPGYRLGRLMAVLERLQGAAQNNPNKTIVDRYYGAASTRPAAVFPRLMGLAVHHLAKLTTGMEGYYQKLLGEVVDGIGEFPPTLRLEEQGLFALGYYHQRQEFFKKKNSEPANDGETQTGEEE